MKETCRSTYLITQNNSPSKLNAAYAYGNAKELAKVLKKYFNIPINAYVLINMGGLKTIINKVGGVDITPNLTFTKGEKIHMDGAKALAYSRMRLWPAKATKTSLGSFNEEGRKCNDFA